MSANESMHVLMGARRDVECMSPLSRLAALQHHQRYTVQYGTVGVMRGFSL